MNVVAFYAQLIRSLGSTSLGAAAPIGESCLVGSAGIADCPPANRARFTSSGVCSAPTEKALPTSLRPTRTTPSLRITLDGRAASVFIKDETLGMRTLVLPLHVAYTKGTTSDTNHGGRWAYPIPVKGRTVPASTSGLALNAVPVTKRTTAFWRLVRTSRYAISDSSTGGIGVGVGRRHALFMVELRF